MFLYDNLNWMLFNLGLALIPLVLVHLLKRKLNSALRIVLLFLWFIFLPNTIYLVTDLEYLPYQIFRTGYLEQAFLFTEYGILTFFGVFSYLYSLEPMEFFIKKIKGGGAGKNAFYIALHTIVAFGVVMGKVQRTHSWYIFTNPQRVVTDAIKTLSANDLVFWIFFCAVVINGFFFVFKKYFPAFAIRKKKSA